MTKITEAMEADLPGVHKLIGELATFERAPQEFTLTIERFIEDFQKGLFFALVAKKGEEVIGMAVLHNAYSTWKGNCLYLEDIIVTEQHRGKGVGKLLFEACIKLSVQRNAERLRWQVLDWNEPAIQFYKKYNANFDKEWLTCRLSKDELLGY